MPRTHRGLATPRLRRTMGRVGEALPTAAASVGAVALTSALVVVGLRPTGVLSQSPHFGGYSKQPGDRTYTREASPCPDGGGRGRSRRPSYSFSALGALARGEGLGALRAFWRGRGCWKHG